VIELSISDADVAKPMSIAQSRVQRARILLGYREDPSFFAVARAPELWDGTTVWPLIREHGLNLGLERPRAKGSDYVVADSGLFGGNHTFDLGFCRDHDERRLGD
jgi:hypothetical protein